MTQKKNWLPPNLETEEQKAQRKRHAKENSVQGVVEKLEQMQAEAKKPKSKPKLHNSVSAGAPLPQQQRTDPVGVTERPDPIVLSQGYEPRVIHQVEPSIPEKESPTAQPTRMPDPRLVEIARLWSALSERDKEELLLIVRVKIHLNQKSVE
jgi:hypothetical protein